MSRLEHADPESPNHVISMISVCHAQALHGEVGRGLGLPGLVYTTHVVWMPTALNVQFWHFLSNSSENHFE